MNQFQVRKTDRPKAMPKASELTFGQHFTDHWFQARYKDGQGWYDSKIEPYGTIAMDPAATVLQYGQTLFEGLKAYQWQDGSVHLFRPEFNYHRMAQGAE